MEKTKKLAVGILAHVDAGKTTLAEGILYKTGQIRKAGRVDHKDAFLDTEELEKARGITIFSKQAVLKLNETEVTLLDTPGHVDFSAEMERTLQVMDYAVLLISGADGVQGHVETLWRLLARYEIPVFLFINKMDQPGTDAEKLLEELQSRLSEHCLNFSQDLQNAELLEELAMCDEDVLEQYLETGSVEEDQIRTMIAERKVFPCCFGSALKMEGVTEFLKILDRFTKTPEYGGDFGARVFKISRDTAGNRLTHLKITGGVLKVKQMLGEEKADQIRIYSGAGYTMVQEAPAGTICAVTGLNSTFSGQGIGNETEADVENPTGSVFCAHGAGFVVPWNEVEDHMHLEYTLENPEEESDSAESAADRSGGASSVQKAKKASDRVPMAASLQEAEELEEIFTRTYGKVERKRAGFERRTRPVTSSSGIGDPKYAKSNRPKEPQEEYLLVDGYNIIFAWDDLNELAKYNIESARGKLMDILSNYQGYKKMTLILVFDAYKVKGNQGEVGMYHNIHVVYTKEAETADQYIEKTVHRIGHNGNVTVASSDGLEQIIIMGAGAHRLSARDLRTEIEHTNGQIRENYLEKEQKTKSYLLENASGELGDFLKELEEERKKESKKSKGKA